MSRGPGRVQKTILDALQRFNQPVQRNKLLWALANRENKIEVDEQLCENIYAGWIEDSYIKSFQRALKRLSETDNITLYKKKLCNIEELIEFYPYKTASLEIFLLRLSLLPLIKDYLESPWSPLPYSTGDNESYILEKIKVRTPDRIDLYAKQWRRLEDKILRILPGMEYRIKDLWVKLLIKGRQLFLDKRADYGMAFHLIIEEIEGEPQTAELGLIEEIQEFKIKVFKPEIMKHNKLKSQLHLVANFGEGSKPTLKNEIKVYFRDEMPHIIENLPDFHNPQPVRYFRLPPSYDPILDRLIDRYVFSKFEFITMR